MQMSRKDDDSKTRPTTSTRFHNTKQCLRVNMRHFGGKSDSRLHSTTGFSANVVVGKRGYQILGVQHIIN